MPEFRKKPVVIEAEQFESATAPLPFRGRGDPVCFDGARFFIETLEGLHIVRDGDWIIRGVKGEFYPCKPDIFAATYEPASVPLSPDPPVGDRVAVTSGMLQRGEAALLLDERRVGILADFLKDAYTAGWRAGVRGPSFDPLRDALRPFAEAFRREVERGGGGRVAWNAKMPGNWPIEIKVTMADGRAAVAALRAPERKDG